MTTKDYTIDEIEVFYRFLGLEPGVPIDEVKNEYRFQSKAFHPDRFEKESKAQKRAHTKFIELTEAYEAIKQFLDDCPDGKPEGGWPGVSRKEEAANVVYESKDGQKSAYINWQDWKLAQQGGSKSQSEATKTVLQEWKEIQDLDEKSKSQSFSREERAKVAFWGRLVAVIAIPLLWIGHGQSIDGMNWSIGQKIKSEESRINYEYKVGKITKEEGHRQIQKIRDDIDSKKRQNEITGWTIRIFGIVVVYVCFFPRPRRMIRSWVEGSGLKNDKADT